LWQERLDKMLLVEHLKKKLMLAHGEFVEASDLILKSHAWLTKEALLADQFAVCISHVPPARSDKIDLLYAALFKTRRELEDMTNAFEDHKMQQKIARDKWVNTLIEHQTKSISRKLRDDICVAWSFQAQRSNCIRLTQVRRVLESRVFCLESGYAAQVEELEESQRQWDEEKHALTEDRDHFKKAYEKMVRAHEQAMEDLKNSQGSAEDMAKMIQVLSVEKYTLTDQVQTLEEDKRLMTKQLVELRDEMAKKNAEIRRLGRALRDSESTLSEIREELAVEQQRVEELQGLLEEARLRELGLRDELAASRAEYAAALQRIAEGEEALAAEIRAREAVEAERGDLQGALADLHALLERERLEAQETLEQAIERGKRELEEFKHSELTKIREDFRNRMEALERRNAQLEKEIAIGDAAGPHLAVLNPLAVDNSRICQSCKKSFVFDGVLPDG